MTPHSPERRKHRRFVLAMRATVVLGSSHTMEQGYLVDLSENGASLTIPSPVAMNVGAYLSFMLSPSTKCEATGTVVRTIPFGNLHGIGIELVYANAGYLNFLRNLEAVAEAAKPSLLADIRELKVRFG
jgi:hypothetical protein